MSMFSSAAGRSNSMRLEASVHPDGPEVKPVWEYRTVPARFTLYCSKGMLETKCRRPTTAGSTHMQGGRKSRTPWRSLEIKQRNIHIIHVGCLFKILMAFIQTLLSLLALWHTMLNVGLPLALLLFVVHLTLLALHTISCLAMWECWSNNGTHVWEREIGCTASFIISPYDKGKGSNNGEVGVNHFPCVG